MTINIMSEYIELTKKQITAYLRLVFEDNYSKKYNDLYENDDDRNKILDKLVPNRGTNVYLQGFNCCIF